MEFLEKHRFMIVIFVFIVLVFAVSSKGEVNDIVNSGNETSVSKLVNDKNVVIIDVRGYDDYKMGHIPNAINVSYNGIIDNIDYNKNTKIAVYCNNGSLSHVAAQQLHDAGYKNVYDMGSIKNYKGKLSK